MNKGLQPHLGALFVYLGHLFQSQLTGEYCLLEAPAVELPHLIGGAYVHLCAGMQWQRQLHGQQCRVLHYQSVNPNIV